MQILLIATMTEHLIEMSTKIEEQYTLVQVDNLEQSMPHLLSAKLEALLLIHDGPTTDAFLHIQWLLERGVQVPIVLMLNQLEDQVVEKALHQGAMEVLNYNDSNEQLVQRVRYAIARYNMTWKRERSFLQDKLTGLPNSTVFVRHLEGALQTAQRTSGYEVGVMHLGVDGLKLINSGLGLDSGDILLQQICERIIKTLRDHDMVARWSGDEFSILLKGHGLERSIHFITKRLLDVLSSRAFVILEQEVFSSVCIGISLSEGQDTANALIQDADIALQKAKRKGHSNYEIFLRAMQKDARERLELQTALRRSLVNRDFILYYQPIISTTSNEVAYFEALVRWNHPEKGLLSPMSFIPLAEETNLIVPLGWQMLHQACRQLVEWKDIGISTKVSVNLSAEQFSAPELLGQIHFCLEVSGVEPESLLLEITETSLIENQEHSANVLSKIREMNMNVYLDDFGTGYSSLAYLEKFPLNGLKIDRAFVSRFVNSPRRGAILQKVVELGQLLDMTVVAEGVEELDELEALQAMDCDLVQGFYYSKPMPPEEVPFYLDKLREQNRIKYKENSINQDKVNID